MIDAALWTGPLVPILAEARWGTIRRATSDRDLSRVALAAEYRGQGEWLLAELERALSGESLIDRARAATLLGFMCDPKAQHILNSWCRHKRPDWVDDALALAHQRRETNRLSQHWFTRFTAESDDVQAWAAFRLFLRCADRRFWVWSPEVEAKASPETYTPRRRRFLRYAKRVVARHVEANERSWKSVFLGMRVMEGQVAPWMD